MTKANWRTCIEWLLWTFVAAVTSNLAGAAVIGVDAWKAAALAGLAALVGGVLAIARWRLSVLPNPGNLTKP